ncbi:helix-turn-helix domain-containing protein [Nocardia sp. CDC153]|uniref:helix-turn-helix domain-containing protein n=1 Tax=Nocardia sp. CDC153 TaxID=3112167 RepID=UPI002DBFF4BF|nr:helix-turn-helix domain-containing protein [Nocardia sp. CDC153]MEC3951549.1 helix-turn-helix domain-containing protein [Nocardia sp. CDC153]
MDGVPTFGEYIRQRRTTANLTRPQLAWLANLSVPYLTKIEGGANPSRRVIESLGTALKLPPAEFEYALVLAEGPLPRIEADHPTAADQEYLDLLNPAIGAYITELWDIVAVNAAHREAFLELEPGANYLEWLIFNPISRTVMVNWETETRMAASRFRMQLARSGEDERGAQVLEKCLSDPDFALLWRSDAVAAERTDLVKLVRDPRTLAITELRINMWRTQSSLQSWLFVLGTTVDRPTAVTRPVVRRRPQTSSPINTTSSQENRPVRPEHTAQANDLTPTKPLQQIDSNLTDG